MRGQAVQRRIAQSRARGAGVTLGAALGGALLALLPAGQAPAQRPAASQLDRVEPGQWQVQARDGSGGRTLVCVASGYDLIQLRHTKDLCRRFVLEDANGAVTIHYECPGNGYGQTRLRLETPRLVQIDTQGVAGGLPFAYAAEARKVGGCGR